MAPPKSQVFNRKHIVSCHVPDPGAAGVDIANYHLFKASQDLTVKKITHVPEAAWVAAAPANDGVVTIKRNNTGTAVATLAVQSALAAGSDNDMGAIASTGQLSEGDELTQDITTNGTADSPASNTVVEFEYDVR